MNGSERNKEQKRQSILRVATGLFKTYGFKKVSINEIAHEANVSPVTIYSHFESKEQLVREVAKSITLDFIEKSREIMQEDRPVPEKLKAIFLDKTSIATQYHSELEQVMAQSGFEMQQWIDPLWHEDIKQVIIDLVEEGKKQGYFKREVSIRAVMLYLEILRRTWVASPDLLASLGTDAELYRELDHLFIYGLIN